MKFLRHRITIVLIHLLFWARFIFISLAVFPDFHWSEDPFFEHFSILLIVVYANNCILLPFFVKRKLYLIYIVLIGLIAVSTTVLFCSYFTDCNCSILECLSTYLWQTMVPLIFFSLVWALYRFLNKYDDIERIKKEHTEMELHFLKSQINPHVLLNNLNTVYAYSLEKPKEVPDMILKLSDNLKHILYESNALKIGLKKEMDYIDNYMAFQKIRSENIKKIHYEKDIDDLNHNIAPLLLITVIENAFKHSASKSTVEILVTVKNSILSLTCRNQIKKNEEEEEESENTKRLGLKNFQKRLSLLYKDKHKLSISRNEIFTVRLVLELV